MGREPRRPIGVRRTLLAALVVVALPLACGSPERGASPAAAAGEQQLALGRRIYRDGVGADGSAVVARVAGDIRVEGTQFTCVSCHRPSGLGSPEGWLITPPVTARHLMTAREVGPRQRPAYTHGSLQRALRAGVDPAGRELQAPMPRYDLTEAESQALIAYLATLSAQVSPGVTAEELHFATVVAGDVDPQAMLAVLRTFFDEKNRNTRNEAGRARRGPFFRAQVNESYRRWVLHEWRLEGPPRTWRSQLESFYRTQPVFALVSGLVEATPPASWTPIHEFCNAHKIPGILPNLDLPPEDAQGYYSLYFSRGMLLEAERIATGLGSGPQRQLVQLYRKGTPGEAAAARLREALDGRATPAWAEVQPQPSSASGPAVSAPRRMDIALPTRGALRPEDLTDLTAASRPSALVLWLDLDGCRLVDQLLATRAWRELPVYISSTHIDGALTELPEALRHQALVAHPYRVPVDARRVFLRTKLWLARTGIAPSSPADVRVMGQTHFACMLLGEAMMHVKHGDYFREYLLESIDHMTVVANFCATYPSLSFGPGQRFLSKGCYLLQPGDIELGPGALQQRWRVP